MWLISDRGVTAIGRVPGFEDGVDAVVELEAAVFHQPHGGHRGNGFADGGGLESGGGFDGAVSFDIGDSIGFGPVELKVPHHRDADAGNVEAVHELGEREAVEALMIGLLGGFDAGDDAGGVVLCANRRESDQQDYRKQQKTVPERLRSATARTAKFAFDNQLPNALHSSSLQIDNPTNASRTGWNAKL